MQPHELVQRYEDVQASARCHQRSSGVGNLTAEAAAILVFAGIVDDAVTDLCQSLSSQ